MCSGFCSLSQCNAHEQATSTTRTISEPAAHLRRATDHLPARALQRAHDDLPSRGLHAGARFWKAFAVARGRDGGDYAWRAYVACWAGQHAAQLEGGFVERGVDRGHLSAAVINYVEFARLASKTFDLFDTFAGLVESQVTPEIGEHIAASTTSALKTFGPSSPPLPTSNWFAVQCRTPCRR